MSYSPSLKYLRENRKMPWIKRGMKIVVDGREGHVAGGFGSVVAVKFPDLHFVVGAHPFWKTVYYNKDGSVLRNYCENQSWIASGRDNGIF